MSQLRIIDFSDDEINQLLDYLYPALANEIEQLRTLMQGQKDSTITGSMYM